MELGGKCPVFVDPKNADYTLIARRILWGRTLNAGQICVGPEYILIPSTTDAGTNDGDAGTNGGTSASPQDRLIEAFKTVYKEFYPDGAEASEDFPRIISTESAERVSGYFEAFRKGGKDGKLVLGGKVDISNKFIEPSVIRDIPVNSTDRVMRDEIFGPILCIVPVNMVQDAIDYINARCAFCSNIILISHLSLPLLLHDISYTHDRPVPLALYVFSQDEQVREQSEYFDSNHICPK
jgi:acyl-CoA reductase-like NAD-dependent aldehyde dehydrogenase